MTLATTSSPAATVDVPLPPPIAWGRDLPALPAAVMDLLALVGAEDVDVDELAAKLSLDMALTAKVLRLANSSFYGLRREVTSVPDAIAVLGLRMIKGAVTAAAMTSSFKPPACDGFDFKAFWRRGVATAVAAQMLAFDADVDPSLAFTTGLLYNIGQLVFATSAPERYAPVLALQATSGMDAREAERSLLGIDHAAIGAQAAELWRLPKEIVQALGRPRDDGRGLAQLVDAADCLMRMHAQGDAAALVRTSAALAASWSAAGLTADRWAETAASADLQTQAICASLVD